jgi:hypothetical protein
MPERWPVIITDDDGDTIDVQPAYGLAAGKVFICTSPEGVTLNAAQLEQFAQAKVAASHEADRQARPAPCGAVSPYAGPPCAEQDAHAEHVSRGPGGVVLARWPVSDGPGPAPRGSGKRCQAAHPTARPTWTCTADPGHAPLDHAAYGINGELCATWPVSSDE